MSATEEMEEQTLKELHHNLLHTLKTIDRVCQEHGLRYYIIAGTMLGAVRHKGFVPWDDDADVALPRPDYEKLLTHANEWLPEPYELVSAKQDKMYPYVFARIQDASTTYILRRHFEFVGGLPVDVFPLDGMTENRLLQRWHYFKFALAKKLLYFSTVDPYKHGHGVRCLLPLLMRRIISQSWAHRHADNVQKEYAYECSRLVADHDNKPSRGILPREVYGTPTPIDFEGTRLMGVAQADTYLRYCYGDYMQMPHDLPPQNFRYLDLKTPYRTYVKLQSFFD